jgi:dTDP-4-dehydrorhamnose 3,5-epimerase/CDP-3, 6-dideoxy-D-glycero-D-glycero-4-hexulose-5-epimerase
MNEVRELLPNCYCIPLRQFKDDRGSLVKIPLEIDLPDLSIKFESRDEFFSISKRNVIRGMHFQLPPYDHEKFVFCVRGAVQDVLLDLRMGSDYGCTASLILEACTPTAIYIPPGVAHGFKSLVDDTVMYYKTSSTYQPDFDSGILFDSFGFDWALSSPILSDRDVKHQRFVDFESPFNVEI